MAYGGGGTPGPTGFELSSVAPASTVASATPAAANIAKGVGRSWLDRVGGPEALVKGAGQMFMGNAQNDVANRGLDIDEWMMRLRQQQFDFESSPDRWREAMLMRGPTGRWA